MENIEFNNAPVLLITYKRPENTEKLLKILLENKIKNIFIYNNGPINKIDLKDCKRTKDIVKKYSVIPCVALLRRRPMPWVSCFEIYQFFFVIQICIY